jgi:hypothetical protein
MVIDVLGGDALDGVAVVDAPPCVGSGRVFDLRAAPADRRQLPPRDQILLS